MTHVGIYSKIMTQPIQLQVPVSENCLLLIKSMLEGISSKTIASAFLKKATLKHFRHNFQIILSKDDVRAPGLQLR